MDPVASDFFLSPYFPVLIYSMARDLTGRTMDHHAWYRPGSRIAFDKNRNVEEVNVTAPDGMSTTEELPFDLSMKQLGVYTVQQGQTTNLYACSVPGTYESLLDNSKVLDTHRPIEQGWPLSIILVAVGLTIIAVESMLYHRRKVG
jgi:hypothetical protein